MSAAKRLILLAAALIFGASLAWAERPNVPQRSRFGNWVSTSDFGAICDGKADDRSAFVMAINEAKATSGLLRISAGTAGYSCRISRRIDITAIEAPRDQLRIVQDPDVVILMSCDAASGGGYLRFDGADGRWNFPTVEGGTIKCTNTKKADGKAWALQFYKCDRARVNGIRITYGRLFDSDTANGVLLDNVTSADIGIGSMNYIQDASIAIQAQNTSNFVKISNNEIEGSTVHAIYTPDRSDGTSGNNAMIISNNYIELNRDAIRIGDKDADYSVNDNYINDNYGVGDVTLRGFRGKASNNSIVNNSTTTNIYSDGADIKIVGNICANNSGAGFFINLDKAQRAYVEGNKCTRPIPKGGAMIRNGGSQNTLSINLLDGVTGTSFSDD
jgi:hypothetical protein